MNNAKLSLAVFDIIFQHSVEVTDVYLHHVGGRFPYCWCTPQAFGQGMRSPLSVA